MKVLICTIVLVLGLSCKPCPKETVAQPPTELPTLDQLRNSIGEINLDGDFVYFREGNLCFALWKEKHTSSSASRDFGKHVGIAQGWGYGYLGMAHVPCDKVPNSAQ